MNRSPYLYVSVLFLAISFILLLVLFFLFSRRYNLLHRNILSPLSFIDYCFYDKGVNSTLSAVILFVTLSLGGCVEYFKDNDITFLCVYMLGVFSIILFFLHCRFFSKKIFSMEHSGVFIKEYLSEFSISHDTLLLWISRILYITCTVLIFR